jgi:predicted dehydrogenase
LFLSLHTAAALFAQAQSQHNCAPDKPVLRPFGHLYDFAVHWVDMTVNFFVGQSAEFGTGTIRKVADQFINPPMAGGAILQFTNGFATLGFDGHSKQESEERITITGSKGVLCAVGPVCKINQVKLETETSVSIAELEGEWFDDGFRGTMGELLCAIEEDRQPFNSGRNNLNTLAAVFAVIAAVDSGQSVQVGAHRTLDEKCQPTA